ncbi:pre-mRNA-splicing factor RBM22, putative [Plasmodium malariae]|uniref:Pre-mRNA-splicing factor RBM22, putative n=1 Tax=Plasmodium malariae TaxID=5858 RepID=A0A1C3L3J4_PLAMA|nr:pre-mRNA-splicing factor RBM22, putative [Plasmodium malariae]
MDRFGHNIRADVKKQGYENSDLPILCETCLGENPYVRLIREENGKECKICKNVFTHFRWKPGEKARYKQTVICNMCAKVKNVCQTCLFDLEYNLPVQVRDKFLETSITLPENETNKNFFLEQMEKNLSSNTYNKMNHINMDLSKLKRYDPYFKRNMARVCSFWRKNACNRGDECPYLHKEIHFDKSLFNQNIKSRYTGENDVLAEKILKKYNNKYTDDNFTKNKICIHGINESVSQINIRECFKKFGEIKSFKMIPKDSKLFISYADPLSAKNAAEKYKDGLELNGSNLMITLQEQTHNNTLAVAACGSTNITASYNHSEGYNTREYKNQRHNNHRHNCQRNNCQRNNNQDNKTIHQNQGNFVPPPQGMMMGMSHMHFPNYGNNINPISSNTVPYSSMVPSVAEQRK